LETQIAGIAANFTRLTGKRLFITSGVRNARGQAAAMYDKFRAGSNGSDYANQPALREIRQTYLRDVDRRSRSEVIHAMTEVIARQIQRGVFISRHLSGRAFDIRSVDISAPDRAALDRIVHEQGGQLLPEGHPPHIHIQLPHIQLP
jgi:hypothetical protein